MLLSLCNLILASCDVVNNTGDGLLTLAQCLNLGRWLLWLLHLSLLLLHRAFFAWCVQRVRLRHAFLHRLHGNLLHHFRRDRGPQGLQALGEGVVCLDCVLVVLGLFVGLDRHRLHGRFISIRLCRLNVLRQLLNDLLGLLQFLLELSYRNVLLRVQNRFDRIGGHRGKNLRQLVSVRNVQHLCPQWSNGRHHRGVRPHHLCVGFLRLLPLRRIARADHHPHVIVTNTRIDRGLPALMLDNRVLLLRINDCVRWRVVDSENANLALLVDQLGNHLHHQLANLRK